MGDRAALVYYSVPRLSQLYSAWMPAASGEGFSGISLPCSCLRLPPWRNPGRSCLGQGNLRTRRFRAVQSVLCNTGVPAEPQKVLWQSLQRYLPLPLEEAWPYRTIWRPWQQGHSSGLTSNKGPIARNSFFLSSSRPIAEYLGCAKTIRDSRDFRSRARWESLNMCLARLRKSSCLAGLFYHSFPLSTLNWYYPFCRIKRRLSLAQ